MKKSFQVLQVISYLALCGCEDAFDANLEEPSNIIVVDAWINDRMETQEIYVTRSQTYFENEFPPKIDGAVVFVEDLSTGARYDFVETEEAYIWEPSTESLGIIGHEYRLSVTVEDETFEAVTDLSAVPPIDSVIFRFEEEDQFVAVDHYRAEFVATDLPGEGDTYWIKAWKNGEFLSKPDEMNLAYDAGVNSGTSLDGNVFIQPIQEGINPFDDTDDGEDGLFKPPYVIGDSVYVEIHSISNNAFDYLVQVQIQTDRPGGFGELFATPLANVNTNLVSTIPGSTTAIAGFFNVATISSDGRRLTQELADAVLESTE